MNSMSVLNSPTRVQSVWVGLVVDSGKGELED